ncbi:MAG: BatA domain-containing protein [Verrucomicrobiota bacterium]
MAFLVPAVLAGAAAVAAPIAIHLLNKTRVKVVRWAATRFLLESLQKNKRRLKVEDLILLGLRCLFIVLLALAFARFVLNPGGSQESAGSAPVVAVMLFDQSASMGQSNGFQTRFDQAKDAAGKTIGGMGSGSQVALFLIGNHINQVLPRPTSNLPLVRRSLDVAEPTNETSDMGPAIQLALETLKPFTGTKKEIYVFSDGQASAWKDLDKIQKLLAEAPDVHLNVVDLGAKSGEDNLAITTLKAETGVTAAGQLSGFLVEVSNFGTAPATGVRVTLAVDDGAPVDEAMLDTVEPGKSRVIRLNSRFPKPGYYTLRAAIPADRMPVDNERAVAVHVIDQMNVAIVEGTAARSKESRDAYFLANALAPVAPSRRADYYLKIEAVVPSWLQSADLARQGIIFLTNVPKLDAASAGNLEKYVDEGGTLVIFPGSQVQPAAYNDDPVLGPMLPAKLGPKKDAGKDSKSSAWQARGYAHPVASLWNDPKNGNLGSVRATEFFPLLLQPAKDPANDARTIVKYADDTPAVVERPYGKGRVVLFSSAATTDWNNLPIHPNFVPFLQRLVSYLTPDKSAESLVIAPGAVFQAKVPGELAKREVSVIVPNSDGKPRPAGKVELVNQDAVVRYRDTAKTGAYRFAVAGVEKPVAALAVQMDAKESDLRLIPAGDLAALNGGKATTLTEGAATQVAPPTKVRREFWIFFIGCAIFVALLETALAHRFSFAK